MNDKALLWYELRKNYTWVDGLHAYDQRPIGIFDSGIGGLTILKAINKLLPHENLIYFGDLARIPYGTKSKEAITEYSLQSVNFLIKQNVKMIVIACNTIASTVGPEIQNLCQKHQIIYVNLIDCLIRYINDCDEDIVDGNLSIDNRSPTNYLILATPATINSNYYQKLLNQLPLTDHIYAQACELFVPIIEEGSLLYHKNGALNLEGKAVVKQIIAHYLLNYFSCKIDVIILACTHYPIILDLITEVIKGKMLNVEIDADGSLVSPFIMDPAEVTADFVSYILRNFSLSHHLTIAHLHLEDSNEKPYYITGHPSTEPSLWGLQNHPEAIGTIKYYVTDTKERFTHLASIFLGHDIKDVELAVL